MAPVFLSMTMRPDGYADYVWSISPGRNVTLTGPWAPGTLDTPHPDTLGIIGALTEREGNHGPDQGQ